MRDAQVARISHFIRWSQALQALVDLRRGHLDAAAKWAHTAQPRADALMFTDKQVFAIFVRVLLASGQAEAARRCARAQRSIIAPFDHVMTQVQLYLLDVAVFLARGDLGAAQVALAARPASPWLIATPQIWNTGQGSQFTSPQRTTLVAAAGAQLSLDGKGRAFDTLWRCAA